MARRDIEGFNYAQGLEIPGQDLGSWQDMI